MHKYTGAHLPRNPYKSPSLIYYGKSNEEMEVYKFLRMELPKDITLISGDRGVLPNHREIDIYIPQYKLGIEYSGLAFHSIKAGKTPDYHLNKNIMADKVGVRLINIFSDEWNNQKPIVIDILRKAIGKYNNIDYKECELYPITIEENYKFLFKNQLLEPIKSDLYLGIFHQNKLIGCLNIDNKDTWYINRYTEQLGLSIPHIMDKVIKYLQNIDNKPILAEVDRRLFNGIEYIESGLKIKEYTKPTYTLTKDYKKRYSLEYLKLTEGQVDKLNLDRVYDCGKIIFTN